MATMAIFSILNMEMLTVKAQDLKANTTANKAETDPSQLPNGDLDGLDDLTADSETASTDRENDESDQELPFDDPAAQDTSGLTEEELQEKYWKEDQNDSDLPANLTDVS